MSERVLYKQRTTPDAHVADGTFRSSRGPVTAVEVELTLKASDRLRDIVRDLTLDHGCKRRPDPPRWVRGRR